MTDAPARTRPAPLVGEVVRTERLHAGPPGPPRRRRHRAGRLRAVPARRRLVKLVFLPAGTDRPRATTVASTSTPSAPAFARRSSASAPTRSAVDPVAHEATLHFVVHGDEGSPARGPRPRARATRCSSSVRRRVVPDPDAASTCSPGTPARCRHRGRPRTSPGRRLGHAVIEVHGPAGESRCLTRRVQVRWVHQGVGGGRPGAVDTVAAIPELPAPGGRVRARRGRGGARAASARPRRAPDRGSCLSVSGYWRWRRRRGLASDQARLADDDRGVRGGAGTRLTASSPGSRRAVLATVERLTPCPGPGPRREVRSARQSIPQTSSPGRLS